MMAGSSHFGVRFGVPWVPSNWGHPTTSHNITLVSAGSSQHGVTFGVLWVPSYWGCPIASHNITLVSVGSSSLGSHLGSHGSLPVGEVPQHPIISPWCQLGPPSIRSGLGIPWVPSYWGRPTISHNITTGISWVLPLWGHIWDPMGPF